MFKVKTLILLLISSNLFASPTITGFALTDSSGQLWGINLKSAGNLNSSKITSMPSGYLQFNTLGLNDSLNVSWAVTINTTGNLVTTKNPSAFQTFTDISYPLIVDSSNLAQILTVDTSGHLTTQ